MPIYQPPSGVWKWAAVDVDLFTQGLVLFVDPGELLLERREDIVDVFHGPSPQSAEPCCY